MQFYASCHISRILCRNHTTISKWLKGFELCKLWLITQWSYVALNKTFRRQGCCQVILKDIWNCSKSFRIKVNRQLSIMLILYSGTAGWKSSPEKVTVLSLSVCFLRKGKKKSLLFAIKIKLLCVSFDVEYKMVKSKYTVEG